MRTQTAFVVRQTLPVLPLTSCRASMGQVSSFDLSTTTRDLRRAVLGPAIPALTLVPAGHSRSSPKGYTQWWALKNSYLESSRILSLGDAEAELCYLLQLKYVAKQTKVVTSIMNITTSMTPSCVMFTHTASRLVSPIGCNRNERLHLAWVAIEFTTSGSQPSVKVVDKLAKRPFCNLIFLHIPCFQFVISSATPETPFHACSNPKNKIVQSNAVGCSPPSSTTDWRHAWPSLCQAS